MTEIEAVEQEIDKAIDNDRLRSIAVEAGFVYLPNGGGKPHVCAPSAAWSALRNRRDTGNRFHAEPPTGSLWQCPDCGKAWICKGPYWYRLRWWEWRQRRKLRLMTSMQHDGFGAPLRRYP
jgi:hypothetical protein